MPIFPDSPGGRPLRQAFAACRGLFVHAGLFSAFLNVLYLAPSIYMLQVYDRVVPTRGVATLVALTVIFVVAILAVGMLELVRNRLLLRAGLRLDVVLAGHIIEALLRLAKERGLGVTAATLREFDVLRHTMTGAGVLALFDVPWAPIYVFVCFLIHPAIGFLAIGGAVVLSVLSLLNERINRSASGEAVRHEQQAYSSLDFSLGAAGAIGALGMAGPLVNRHLRERFGATAQVNRANLLSVRFTSAIKAARLLLQSLALGLGALLAIEQQISAGAIFASSLLIARALQPIELINGAWRNLLQARAAYLHLAELFVAIDSGGMATTLPVPVGALSVENLGVATPNRDRLALGGVSFALAAGEMLGVVGPSGAGKSTLARALVGIVPPAQGAVRLDGSDLRNWKSDQLGPAIGYVPQEPILFRGTIKENIARFHTEFAEPGGLDEAVVRAATLCGAHDFIVRLPQGYDTELGWGGSGLSVGQAQRITLARAMYGDPVLVVLDEPNAALDAEGEMRLAQAMEHMRQRGATLVVIAHRAGILQAADKLLVLRAGRVEHFGERNHVIAQLNSPQPDVPERQAPSESPAGAEDVPVPEGSACGAAGDIETDAEAAETGKPSSHAPEHAGSTDGKRGGGDGHD